jgi:hypothetical protein
MKSFGIFFLSAIWFIKNVQDGKMGGGQYS